MASTRSIKRRIKSVGSTKQITKAMNLVAASKLQRAKSKMEDTRPFFNETRRVIASIVNNSKGITHPYLEERPVRNTAVIVVTGDRGLCGGYNTNVSREALKLINTKASASMIVIGNKAKDYFKRRNKNIVRSYQGISEKPFYEDACEIGQLVLSLFTKGEVDEVYLAYTEFKSAISYFPKVVKILPVDTGEFKETENKTTDQNNVASGSTLMSYEPSEEAVLDVVIPKYLNTVIFGALVESAACEQGARMTSMDSATENAEEMIEKLTIKFNRVRQSVITQEINEIVSGANAVD